MRMNLGCGSIQPAGWVNADKDDFGQELPLNIIYNDVYVPSHAGEFDLVFMNHSLQQVAHEDLPAAMENIATLLKPGGKLRVIVPDVVAAFNAWKYEDRYWFPNKDNHDSLDVIFSTYITWYGSARTLFTKGYLKDVMSLVGDVYEGVPGDCELDDRDDESIFMDAVKKREET